MKDKCGHGIALSVPCMECVAMTSGRKNLGRTIREEIVRRMNVVEGSPKQTHPTSFKFDDNTMDLVKALSEKLGVGMTNVVRLAVRKLANHEKVKL